MAMSILYLKIHFGMRGRPRNIFASAEGRQKSRGERADILAEHRIAHHGGKMKQACLDIRGAGQAHKRAGTYCHAST